MQDTSGENMAMAALMDSRESWAEYVTRITKGIHKDRVAKAADIHVTGVYRWLRSPKPPSAEKAISFARGLGQPPTEALVAAGYLEPDEAEDVIEVHQSVDDLSDEDMLASLAKRLRERGGDGQVAPVEDIARRFAPPVADDDA